MSAMDDFNSSLQKELETLKKDNAALRGELKAGADESNATAIQEAVLPHVPRFISNIVNLADGADSESVQLSANKLLIEWVVGGKLGGNGAGADTEFKDFLNSIKKKAYDNSNVKNPVIPPKAGQ